MWWITRLLALLGIKTLLNNLSVLPLYQIIWNLVTNLLTTTYSRKSKIVAIECIGARSWFASTNNYALSEKYKNASTDYKLHHTPSRQSRTVAQTVPLLRHADPTLTELSSESSGICLLCLIQFSKLSQVLTPRCYCGDQIIPGHKNTPGSESAGVQVLSVSGIPHAWGMS